MVAAPDALALLYLDTDSGGLTPRAYIAFLLVRRGRRGRGTGGEMIAAICARLPGVPLRPQCRRPRAVAFFERYGFIRSPGAGRWLSA